MVHYYKDSYSGKGQNLANFESYSEHQLFDDLDAAKAKYEAENSSDTVVTILENDKLIQLKVVK